MDLGKLKEVASVFLKLGCIAFGGPAAHIAMMEDEIVHKRKWISREYFLDLVGATNLIPGPNSTELTMHCGYERAGIYGLFVAGVCFIFPAALITGIIAWLYVVYGNLPSVEPFVYGIKPAVIAIVINAVYKLGFKALKNWQLGAIGVGVATSTILGVNEIYALLGAGLVASIWFVVSSKFASRGLFMFSPYLTVKLPALVYISSTKLFFVFLKIGATLFGSGYVLIAYLEAELVDKGFITKQQLLDAIAVGQFTPGPLFTSATFVGFQIDGIWGCMLATVGIFLPSFFLVMLLHPFLSRLRDSKLLGYFLDGVNVGAVGVMVTAIFSLGVDVLVDWRTWIIAVLSVVVIFGFQKLNATWLVVGGALLGYVMSFWT